MTYPKDELLPEICQRLAEGEPLAAICRDPHMPAARTVRAWVLDDESVSAAIARARVLGYDAIAEQCLEIADTPRVGVKKTTKPLTMRNSEGDVVATGEVLEEVTEADMIEHRKLQIETRMKLLAKWDPKRFGERQAIEHSVTEDTAAILAGARRRAGGG